MSIVSSPVVYTVSGLTSLSGFAESGKLYGQNESFSDH